ncbi:DNA-directed RNA polymerase I subunit RPA12-like isoform X2 [Corylus avellana]|nr:DNA-directed RNA polymerase I subunit RPA12-like isoform X2 [Corylus avellana]XP_059454162.1 DNA-directed RNA polymerase I subunit RPA12-like isoform X2 [Corylus avellana]
MAYSHERDFLFCDLCGTMLSMKSTEHAKCPQCKFERSMKEICNREISYVITTEDIRMELGISLIRDQEVQLSKVKKKCEKCYNDEAEFWTMQMRSADEGQTTFYRCTKCGHKYSEN